LTDFEITQEIRDLGVSKVEIRDSELCIYNGDGRSYTKSKYVSTNLVEIQKSFENLTAQMVKDGHFGNEETVKKIIILVTTVLSKQSGKKKQPKKKSEKRIKEFFIHKYSQNMPLSEEISIGDSNVFLQVVNGEPKIFDKLDLSKEKGFILHPHHSVATYEYKYDDLDDVKKFIDIAKGMRFNDLYFLVKSIWKDIVVPNEKELIPLLAADTIVSYFQDLFITTHYTILTGPPGRGKGVILLGLKVLAYRVVLAGDMSGANLLDLLGTVERCQVSIAEDEFDNLDKDPDKERLYKMGYEDVGLVTRTADAGSSNRKLNLYNPFCMKWFACESPPDAKEFGGFNDRTFVSEVKKAKPKFLIKNIKKQMEYSVDKQLPKYRAIISKINFLRKVLMMFRLLHHDDVFEEVPVNIDGRALELTGPSITLFNSDDLPQQDNEALNEVLDALSYFLRKKSELSKKTVEAVIFSDVLENLFGEMDSGITDDLYKKDTKIDIVDNSENTSYIIAYDKICETFLEQVEGDQLTPRTIISADFQETSHDSILEKCRLVFGAKDFNLHIGPNRKRKKALTFNRNVVEDAGSGFDIISEIKILEKEDEIPADDPEDARKWNRWRNEVDNGDNGRYTDSNIASDGNQVTTFGQNTDLDEKSETAKIPENERENTPKNGGRHQNSTRSPSEPKVVTKLPAHKPYWLGSLWHCENCSITGDRFTMENSHCSMSKRRK
jgi:hypothetical protein